MVVGDVGVKDEVAGKDMVETRDYVCVKCCSDLAGRPVRSHSRRRLWCYRRLRCATSVRTGDKEMRPKGYLCSQSTEVERRPAWELEVDLMTEKCRGSINDCST